jgi:hypothetical protein
MVSMLISVLINNENSISFSLGDALFHLVKISMEAAMNFLRYHHYTSHGQSLESQSIFNIVRPV